MDFVKNAMGGAGDKGNAQQQGGNPEKKEGEGGFMSGISDKFNSAAGGGKESEKNEDYLDKGIDYVQQYGFKQGDQSNESAVEQAKDEQISDFIRDKYKSVSGNDVPIEDKPTKFS